MAKALDLTCARGDWSQGEWCVAHESTWEEEANKCSAFYPKGKVEPDTIAKAIRFHNDCCLDNHTESACYGVMLARYYVRLNDDLIGARGAYESIKKTLEFNPDQNLQEAIAEIISETATATTTNDVKQCAEHIMREISRRERCRPEFDIHVMPHRGCLFR